MLVDKIRWQKLWVGFLAFKGLLFLILYPIVLLPIPLMLPGQPSRGAYVLLLMAGYWITEVIPIYVTALLPILLAPMMGIAPSKEICAAYMKDTNMLFIAGLLVACALEHNNLHRRIAILVLKMVGTDPKMLLLGFMLPTWFLSMWMSNTATTAMMVTIVEAVLSSLATQNNSAASKTDIVHGVYSPNRSLVTPDSDRSTTNDVSMNKLETTENRHRPHDTSCRLNNNRSLSIALSLCVCYASSCGGIATVTGTAPNSIFFGQVNNLFGEDTGLSFGSWMAVSCPISLLMLTIIWIWLTLLHFGPRSLCSKNKDEHRKAVVKKIIEEESEALGEFSYGEMVCCILFASVAALWVTRDLGHHGWGRFFHGNEGESKGYVTDTQPGLLIGLLALVFPASNLAQIWRRRWQQYRQPMGHVEFHKQFLLPWTVVQKNLHWGVFFLLGGGFALSDICEKSGLSLLIGNFLGEHFVEVPLIALTVVCCLIAGVMTEFTSNSATSSILLPIMFRLSSSLGIHPFRLAIPVTISTSFAYTLPAATPPNSIVFGKGRVQVHDMIKSGLPLNIAGCLVTIFAANTYAIPLFGLDHAPEWAGNFTRSG